MSNQLDKTPFQMQPPCISCILDVAYKFLVEGLQIEKFKQRINTITNQLENIQKKEVKEEENNENDDLIESLNEELDELKEEFKERRSKEWEGTRILIQMMSELTKEDSYPVIIASKMFNKVKELSDNPDPWIDLKAMSNLICMNLEYDVREYLSNIEDQKEKLRTAFIFSALANTIDFSTAMHKVDLRFNFAYFIDQLEIFEENGGFAKDDFDLLYERFLLLSERKNTTPEEIGEMIEENEEFSIISDDDLSNVEEFEDFLDDDELKDEELHDDEDYEEFNGVEHDEFDDSEKGPVVFLLDNAGEIVLDKLLIEILVDMGVDVISVVKGDPISNDATFEDAEEIDLTSVCDVITTGSDDLGFNPNRASEDFLSLIQSAPLVIAKGQANFESINTFRESILNPEIFLLSKLKCDVNANLARVKVGDYVIWKMQ